MTGDSRSAWCATHQRRYVDRCPDCVSDTPCFQGGALVLRLDLGIRHYSGAYVWMAGGAVVRRSDPTAVVGMWHPGAGSRVCPACSERAAHDALRAWRAVPREKP